MENKKLLKYLLSDLSELNEMFAEKNKNSFDELEMEFVRNRISGASRLVELFLGNESDVQAEVKTEITQQEPKSQNVDSQKDKTENTEEVKIQEINPAVKTSGVWIEEKIQKTVVQEIVPENKIEEKVPETIVEEKAVVVENKIVAPEIVQPNEIEMQKGIMEETPKQKEGVKNVSVKKDLQLDDEDPIDIKNKRLGDSFLKEKSVNDIMSDDLSKLEHKLSNRPVSSIQSAIGINDRFQYIRELFEGSADNFVKTVADLDSMDDLKDAVGYLQDNFKWKKNEASLKFVNLIKRRFPNE